LANVMEVRNYDRFNYIYRWFSHLVSLSIFLNCLCLSIYDYKDRNSLSNWNKVLDELDAILSIIFIVEAIIKIIAMGFIIHRYSYLRQGWNVIDFIIAISG
jgi:hypothetical protein